jgi:hypothetical protein
MRDGAKHGKHLKMLNIANVRDNSKMLDRTKLEAAMNLVDVPHGCDDMKILHGMNVGGNVNASQYVNDIGLSISQTA